VQLRAIDHSAIQQFYAAMQFALLLASD